MLGKNGEEVMNEKEIQEIIKETEEWLQLTRTTNIYARARIVVGDLLRIIKARENDTQKTT